MIRDQRDLIKKRGYLMKKRGYLLLVINEKPILFDYWKT